MAKWLRMGLVGLAVVAVAQTSSSQQAELESTTRPVPREGKWMEMHESFRERAQQGNIDLLFLGDSITQGWRGVPDLWDRYYRARDAANFGIGGDRTQHVLWRLEHGEIDGIHPKVVVLMIGTNNARDHTPDEIAEGITAIVNTLEANLPETKILLLAVFPRGETPDALRTKLASVNTQIARLGDRPRVTFLDIGAHFLDDDGSISPEIMPDFLHLSRKGYRIWADAIEPTLWSLMEE